MEHRALSISRTAAAAVLGCLLALGCVNSSNKSDRSVLPPVGARGDSADLDRLRDALFTVFFHAYEIDDPELEAARRIQPPPHLSDAVSALLDDDSSSNRSRRFRAIATLAGAKAAGVRDIDRFDDEIEDLLGPEEQDLGPIPVAGFFGELRAHFRDAAPTRSALTQFVSSLLSSLFGAPVAGCATSDLDYWAVKRANDIVEGWVEIRVNRPKQELAEVMDPQNWDQCLSLMFPATYLAAQESDGSYLEDSYGTVAPQPTPAAPGSSWDAVVYEHFAFPYFSWYRTLLSVRTLNTVDDYWLDYALYRSNKSNVMGDGPLPGGIEIDQGYGWINDEGGGWSRYEGLKIVRFSGRPGTFPRWYMNALIRVIVLVMMSDMESWLCCPLP